MSYYYSRKSKAILSQVDIRLQRLFNEVIKHVDISIISGVRTAAEQQALFNDGASTKDGVNSKSKHQAGKAIDFCAYGDGISFSSDDNHFIAGIIWATAQQMGLNIRSGARWSRKLCSDVTLHDPFHVELA